MNDTNNPLAEIGPLVLSVAILAAMTVLFVFGKINFIESIPFLTAAASVYGVKVAAQAPSPAQQENLQQLISLLASRLQPVPTTPTQPINPPALNTTTSVQSPVQFVSPSPLAAIQPTGEMPAVVPPETK